MEYILHDKRLWKIVSWIVEPPKEGTVERSWFDDDDKLGKGYMILNVSEALVHYISYARSANEAWKNLCSTFERMYVINWLYLR